MNKIERGVFKFKDGMTMIFHLNYFFFHGIIDDVMLTNEEGRKVFLKRTRMSNLVEKAIVWEEVSYDKIS